MRVTPVLALLLVAPLGRAQTSDAWRDFESQEQALENTSTQDCAMACKALDSLARAAQHICEVSPEHCDEAKSKLRAALERVWAACPQCEVRAHAGVGAPPSEATATAQDVAEVRASKGGGCAGCTTAPQRSESQALTLGVLLLVGAGIRRRRSKR